MNWGKFLDPNVWGKEKKERDIYKKEKEKKSKKKLYIKKENFIRF